jgi:hypothetical protein
VVGFITANYSIAKTEEQWKYLTHFFLYSCMGNIPELFIPTIYPEYAFVFVILTLNLEGCPLMFR